MQVIARCGSKYLSGVGSANLSEARTIRPLSRIMQSVAINHTWVDMAAETLYPSLYCVYTCIFLHMYSCTRICVIICFCVNHQIICSGGFVLFYICLYICRCICGSYACMYTCMHQAGYLYLIIVSFCVLSPHMFVPFDVFVYWYDSYFFLFRVMEA